MPPLGFSGTPRPSMRPPARGGSGRGPGPGGGPGGSDRIGNAAQGLWALESAWNLVTKLTGTLLPSFIHACTVTVVGGPNADLRRVWYLCCSAAFGRMKRSPALLGGDATMQATWDVTGKVARIELAYKVATLPSNIGTLRTSGENVFNQTAGTSAVTSVLGIPTTIAPGALPKFDALIARRDNTRAGVNPKLNPLAVIQVGPDQLTIGAGWPDFLTNGVINETFASRPNDLVEGFNLRSQRPLLPLLGAGGLVPYKIVQIQDYDEYPDGNLLREHPTGGGGLKFKITSVPYRIVGLEGLSATPASPIGDGLAPTLPDDGRIITTGEKLNASVQPVRPLLDGATRTSLIALVAAALETPCYLPESPPLTDNPLFTDGVFVHDSGIGVNMPYERVAQIVNTDRPGYDARNDGPLDGYVDRRIVPDLRSE